MSFAQGRDGLFDDFAVFGLLVVAEIFGKQRLIESQAPIDFFLERITGTCFAVESIKAISRGI